MQKFWIALSDITSDIINSLNGVTLNQSIAAFLAAHPGSYIEYNESTTPDEAYYPNLVILSSETASFGAVVNNINVTASILGGSHSPVRPK